MTLLIIKTEFGLIIIHFWKYIVNSLVLLLKTMIKRFHRYEPIDIYNWYIDMQIDKFLQF